MANEAVIIELPRNIHPVMRTVADSGTIEKLTCLVLSDPNTVAASSGRDVWGGIAAAEKVTLDGSTKLAVHLDGVFDVTAHSASGTIALGSAVTLSGANLFALATEAEIVLGKFAGYCEETVSSGEVFRLRLKGS